MNDCAAPNRLRRRHRNATGATSKPTSNDTNWNQLRFEEMLGAARSRRLPLPEIVLWSTASQHPSESQTSECSDLLSRSRATCLIVAQRQPGKLTMQRPPNRQCQRATTVTGANGNPSQLHRAKGTVQNDLRKCCGRKPPKN